MCSTTGTSPRSTSSGRSAATATSQMYSSPSKGILSLAIGYLAFCPLVLQSYLQFLVASGTNLECTEVRELPVSSCILFVAILLISSAHWYLYIPLLELAPVANNCSRHTSEVSLFAALEAGDISAVGVVPPWGHLWLILSTGIFMPSQALVLLGFLVADSFPWFSF